MQKDFLLKGKTAVKLYEDAKNFPIYDYHCHLSPKEIYEDKPCYDIGELWLSGDHYKWRLMRAAGIDEYYITGKASYREKFIKYAEAASYALGSPLYSWNAMELSRFFGIDEELNKENAGNIYDAANKYLKDNAVSPRKLIEGSNVRFIATTDDISDNLEWHEKLINDKSFGVKVTPSFRYDNLMQIKAPGYPEYIKGLSEASGVAVSSLETLCAALKARLDYFIAHGCVFTDLGIPDFPDRIADSDETNAVFCRALAGGAVTEHEYLGFLGFMYVFTGRLIRDSGRIMQLHLAVRRNTNDSLFAVCGRDAGGDSIGAPISGGALAAIFNAIAADGRGLPETVVYTLNPSITSELVSVIGSFRGVRMGAAWWFNDHKSGIENVLRTVAETGYLGSFLGMLTDSRSFLSYARHDYFRRILCSFVAGYTDSGEYPAALAPELIKKLCCGNIAGLIEKAKNK